MADSTLIGIAAFVSAMGGLASTIVALRKSRSEEHEECIQQLKAAREESEKLAQELHKIRMGNED